MRYILEAPRGNRRASVPLDIQDAGWNRLLTVSVCSFHAVFLCRYPELHCNWIPFRIRPRAAFAWRSPGARKRSLSQSTSTETGTVLILVAGGTCLALALETKQKKLKKKLFWDRVPVALGRKPQSRWGRGDANIGLYKKNNPTTSWGRKP